MASHFAVEFIFPVQHAARGLHALARRCDQEYPHHTLVVVDGTTVRFTTPYYHQPDRYEPGADGVMRGVAADGRSTELLDAFFLFPVDDHVQDVIHTYETYHRLPPPPERNRRASIGPFWVWFGIGRKHAILKLRSQSSTGSMLIQNSRAA
jgi:hypothetical protein